MKNQLLNSKGFKIRLLLWIVTLSLAQGCRISVTENSGKVVGISDGDTFTMLAADQSQVRVRLYGIDAPEKSQDFGNVSKKFLSDLIYQQQVLVEEIETDQYGRMIAIVKIGDQVVNEESLKAGMAWHYKNYDDNPLWAAMELDARLKKRGLWSLSDPIEPWTFRKSKHKMSENRKR